MKFGQEQQNFGQFHNRRKELLSIAQNEEFLSQNGLYPFL